MRVNIYEEEITERVELVTKHVGGTQYVGVQFHLELPATLDGKQHQGPFMHRPGDDDSSAVTFWSRDPEKLRRLMQLGLEAAGKQLALAKN